MEIYKTYALLSFLTLYSLNCEYRPIENKVVPDTTNRIELVDVYKKFEIKETKNGLALGIMSTNKKADEISKLLEKN